MDTQITRINAVRRGNTWAKCNSSPHDRDIGQTGMFYAHITPKWQSRSIGKRSEVDGLILTAHFFSGIGISPIRSGRYSGNVFAR